MTTDNRTATTAISPEQFVTTNVTVAPDVPPRVVPVAEVTGVVADRPPSEMSESEDVLWEGRYSPKNFFGRLLVGGLLTLGWVVLAAMKWGGGRNDLTFLIYALGIGLVLYWLYIGFKYFRARRNFFYRLTSRRLFITTGIFHQRVDQVELVRVKDLFVRQTLVGNWLDIGNVIIISSEQSLPKAYLLGIEQPKHVLDLIWKQTRVERDQRTTEIRSE